MVQGWPWLNTPAPGMPTASVSVHWATRRFTPRGEVVTDNRAVSYGLLLTVRGRVTVRSAGQTWQVTEGAAFLRSPSVAYDYTFAPDGEFLSVGLLATLFGSFDAMRGLGAPRLWRPEPSDASLLTACLGQLAETTGHTEPAARLITNGLAQTVVGIACRALTPPEVASRIVDTPPWLHEVLLAAQNNPGITVAELAHVAAYSEGQLRRLFHAHLGLSPHAYLQSRRIDAARHLLESTDLPVGAIAERLGFASAPHFTRLFKQVLGQSPRDYRRRSSEPPV